ncbi:hypothetical protein CEXT_751631 [Caerostris extrusa]|uniref:Uncharacterized protein n=1 Tax=Caerostris extrusa TaxID=172846 RepID=A0AAV4NQ81_CAEEX|nr:hypothetical protein CEXT_751631 [Caerostris extrusa]
MQAPFKVLPVSFLLELYPSASLALSWDRCSAGGSETSKLESLIASAISLAPIYFNGSLRRLLKLRDRCSRVQAQTRIFSLPPPNSLSSLSLFVPRPPPPLPLPLRIPPTPLSRA